MTASALPALFLAHGAPTLAIEQHEYAAWLRKLGGILPRPEAVVVFSAHWPSPVQRIACADTYETMHDFFGFPDHLYRLQYPASGDSSLARRIRSLLAAEGIDSELDGSRGLDHGAWGPLMLMYPDADIPVVGMSVNPALVPEEHYRIGRSLGRLRRERVLIVGSGGSVRNMEKLDWKSLHARSWALDFDRWLAGHLETWNTEMLFRYETLAPFAREAVPHPEHLAPLLIAMGSADGGSRRAKLLHRQYLWGTLSLSGWMFG